MIAATLLICTLWTAVADSLKNLCHCWVLLAGATQVIHKTVHIATVGENVTLQCKLSKRYDVVQVTWQKENGKAKTNLATYSDADGSKVLGKDQSHVQISQSGLSISALTFLGVQLKDDGCYNCIFNTFPLGSIPGRTCLKVYSLTEPTLDVKRVASPDNEETELLELSCSVTGKPAPQITWKGIQPLLKKPSQSTFYHPNQTVTVVSNLTYVSSKDAWENPITCVVQHLSSNTTKELTLPEVEMEQAQNKDPGPAVVVVSVFVAVCLLGLTIFTIAYYWRRLPPVDSKPDFLCQILPVCPRNVICRRYSYTGNQVPVKPLHEGTFLDR
ncbi:hypothetical protein lerEdw1_003994 [Lerista edwardsae]|nr:hypothetical protein lerEdw1_003995 [Lerista edwardsae]KAJ6650791.1 hypothetical protein lerEdw1_003994 [Lerista edwardsae]